MLAYLRFPEFSSTTWYSQTRPATQLRHRLQPLLHHFTNSILPCLHIEPVPVNLKSSKFLSPHPNSSHFITPKSTNRSNSIITEQTIALSTQFPSPPPCISPLCSIPSPTSIPPIHLFSSVHITITIPVLTSPRTITTMILDLQLKHPSSYLLPASPPWSSTSHQSPPAGISLNQIHRYTCNFTKATPSPFTEPKLSCCRDLPWFPPRCPYRHQSQAPTSYPATLDFCHLQLNHNHHQPNHKAIITTQIHSQPSPRSPCLFIFNSSRELLTPFSLHSRPHHRPDPKAAVIVVEPVLISAPPRPLSTHG